MESKGRVQGTVQWLSRAKGHGFIRLDGQEEDVFAHYSLIAGDGYRNLRRGQRVEFVMEDSDKALQPAEVTELTGERGFVESIQVAEAIDEGTCVEPMAIEGGALTEAALSSRSVSLYVFGPGGAMPPGPLSWPVAVSTAA